MNITTEPGVAAEPQPATKHILLQGFSLARRGWTFVVLAYAINLVFGLLGGVPVTNGLAPFLDHSLAARRIAGTLDVGSLLELGLHLGSVHLFPVMLQTATWLNVLQLLILFVLFTGTVFVYVSGERPLLSVLFRGGIAYFWRFVRAAILAGCIGVLILGLLLTARATLLDLLARAYDGRTMFVWAAITGAVVFLAALVLRLWFDLVEVYLVRHAMDGELRVRHALLPAYQLLSRHFFRVFGSFLLAGLAGSTVLGLCLLLWKTLPASGVWPAALLAQVGLFCLMASRFWQRGLEASLVSAIAPPLIAVEATGMIVAVEEEPVFSVRRAGLSELPEPTLRELVQKLKNEPWAVPQPEVHPVSPATAVGGVAAEKEPPAEKAEPVAQPSPEAGKPQP